jgi:DNA-binding transcriptional MerR regulator
MLCGSILADPVTALQNRLIPTLRKVVPFIGLLSYDREGIVAGASLKVGELAKRTGISIRTLHYYDEIRLLSPSYRTQVGHRRYGTSDLVRLQQIMSLRQLGFSLDEIRDCLRSPDFSPLALLQRHISRLKEQIECQSKLCARLEAIAVGLRSAQETSAEQLIKTIEEANMMEKYYTPEQIKEIKERGEKLGSDGVSQAENEWQELLTQVRAEMEMETDPASKRVQELAQRWMALVQAFTGGNRDIERSVGRMWGDEQTIHGIETSSMREMMSYISKAIAASNESQ